MSMISWQAAAKGLQLPKVISYLAVVTNEAMMNGQRQRQRQGQRQKKKEKSR